MPEITEEVERLLESGYRTLKVKADGEIGLDELEGLVPEVIDGF